jgi:hypothetical protein
VIGTIPLPFPPSSFTLEHSKILRRMEEEDGDIGRKGERERYTKKEEKGPASQEAQRTHKK